MINFLRQYIAILFVFIVAVFTGPTGFAAPTLGSSGAGGGGSLGAIPSCFVGSYTLDPEATISTEIITLTDAATSWSAVSMLEARHSEDQTGLFSALFTKTTGIAEFTTTDTSAMKLSVFFSVPGQSSATGGDIDLGVIFGGATLDYDATTGDPIAGQFRYQDKNFSGNSGTGVFVLAALGKFAIVVKDDIALSSTFGIKGIAIHAVQESTTARPCT